MTELKPCPFCGGDMLFVGTIAEVEMQDEDHPDYYYNNNRYIVVCDYTEGGCGASCGGATKPKRKQSKRGTGGHMKTDREKLIALIKEANLSMWGRSGISSAAERRAYLADYLISKGVTIPVRCEDCAYWDDDNRCNAPINGLVREYTNFDDFCSYGERGDK